MDAERIRRFASDMLSSAPRFWIFFLWVLFSLPVSWAGATSGLRLPPPDPAEFRAPTGIEISLGELEKLWTDAAPEAGAPVIAEWNKTALPGESLTLTGARFTSADGKKDATTVWIQAGASLMQAQVWILEENLMTISLPDSIEPGLYLLWVQNREGVSRPVAINRTSAQWIGPLGNRTRPGERKRIFGRNISLPEAKLCVRMTPVDGGEGVSLPVISASPYAVEFDVPASTPPGKYLLQVHNGFGGELGWSEALGLEVRAPTPTGATVRLTSADAPRLQAALNEMTSQPEGGTVELEAGVYSLDRQLILRPNVRLVGRGLGETILRGAPVFLQAPPNANIEIRNLTIEEGLRCDSEQRNNFRHDLVHDVWIENVELRGTPKLNLNGTRIAVINSQVPVIDGLGVESWFSGNTIHGEKPAREFRWAYHAALYSGNARHSVIEKNVARNEWPLDEKGQPVYWIEDSKDSIKSWYVRLFLAGSGKGGFNQCYLGENYGENIAGQIRRDDNVGEMILLHCSDGSWFGSVESASDNTVLLSSEPILNADGQSLKFRKMESGGPIRAKENQYLVIIHGPGLGQARRIVSSTDSSVTVDSPWKVPPGEGSRVVVVPLYLDNIIYKNELNAFPRGFPLKYSKAQGISLFGNCWNTAVEGTVTRRAYNAEVIHGRSLSPSYWNEIRSGRGEEIYFSGAHIVTGLDPQPNLAGAVTLGNMIRKGRYQITGPWLTGRGGPMLRSEISQHSPTTPRSELPAHLGNVIEYMEAGGGKIGLSSSRHSKGLFRRNILHLADDPEMADLPTRRGISFDQGSEDRFFENRFENAEEYAAPFEFMHYAIQDTSYRKTVERASSESLTGRLTLLNHVVRFPQGTERASVPIANTGLAPLSVRVAAAPTWLTVDLDPSDMPPEKQGTIHLTLDSTKRPPNSPIRAEVILEADGEASVLGVYLD